METKALFSPGRGFHAALVCAVVTAGPLLGASGPWVETVSVDVDIADAGYGSWSHDISLASPIRLDDVSLVVLDAVSLAIMRFGSGGKDQITSSVALLSEGQGFATSWVTGPWWTDGPADGGIYRPIVVIPKPSDCSIQAVRFVLGMTNLEVGPGVQQTSVRGILPGGAMRLHLIHGPFLSGEGHRSLSLPVNSTLSYSGTGSTSWQEFPFPEEIPAKNLRFVTHGGPLTIWAFYGMNVASQIVLEDSAGSTSYLELDNATSPPSEGAPPNMGSISNSLLLGEDARADLADKMIRAWRVRLYANGTNAGVEFGTVPFYFAYEFADCNENMIPDDEEIDTSTDRNGDGVLDECEPHFKRGDANASSVLDIADAVFTLSHLFAKGTAPSCLDTADANDDGKLDIADAIAILSHLFASAGPLKPPFGECGVDPTEDTLDCASFSPCE